MKTPLPPVYEIPCSACEGSGIHETKAWTRYNQSFNEAFATLRDQEGLTITQAAKKAEEEAGKPPKEPKTMTCIRCKGSGGSLTPTGVAALAFLTKWLPFAQSSPDEFKRLLKNPVEDE